MDEAQAFEDKIISCYNKLYNSKEGKDGTYTIEDCCAEFGDFADDLEIYRGGQGLPTIFEIMNKKQYLERVKQFNDSKIVVGITSDFICTDFGTRCYCGDYATITEYSDKSKIISRTKVTVIVNEKGQCHRRVTFAQGNSHKKTMDKIQELMPDLLK